MERVFSVGRVWWRMGGMALWLCGAVGVLLALHATLSALVWPETAEAAPKAGTAGGRKTLAPGVMNAQARISASSSARESGKQLGPELAFDGDLATVWQEGNPSSGQGEWLEIEFKAPRQIASITLFAGHFSSLQAFEEHNHLAEGELQLVHKGGIETLPLRFSDRYEPLRVEIGREVRKVRLTLQRMYAGSVYAEGCVAELAFNLDLKDPSITTALETWKRTNAAITQLDAWRKRLEEVQQATRQGDLSTLPFLLDAARRGLDPIRAFVSSRVAPGFLMAHIDPDPAALEALRSLALPDAVPAIEQAVWIVDEVDAPAMRKLASFLQASGELKRPPRRNLPRFGVKGWEVGAFQSLGLPLPLVVDRDDYLYIADVGNNRVQRLDSEGRFERSSGSTPTVTDRFLGEERPHYVAGHRPGIASGQLTQPIAIAAGPRDRLVLLDASRRIHLLDADLHLLKDWALPEDAGLELTPQDSLPRIVWNRNRIYCLWDKNIFVYDENGKLQRTVKLERQLRAAVAYKRGLVVYHGGKTLHRYGFDGVYLGELLSLPEEDTSEELDLAVGANEQLFIHTEAGNLYQWDGKGRISAQMTTLAPDVVFPPYRLAVGKTQAFVTAGDQIRAFSLGKLTPAKPASSARP